MPVPTAWFPLSGSSGQHARGRLLNDPDLPTVFPNPVAPRVLVNLGAVGAGTRADAGGAQRTGPPSVRSALRSARGGRGERRPGAAGCETGSTSRSGEDIGDAVEGVDLVLGLMLHPKPMRPVHAVPPRSLEQPIPHEGEATAGRIAQSFRSREGAPPPHDQGRVRHGRQDATPVECCTTVYVTSTRWALAVEARHAGRQATIQWSCSVAA